MLSACNDQSQSESHQLNAKQPRVMQCIEQQSQCYFELAGGRVEVLFDVNRITAEQAFNMSVNYTGANRIKAVSGYMEGVDMFMGKIPVFLEPKVATDKLAVDKMSSLKAQAQKKALLANKHNQQIFRGELLVGSCSAAQMTWQVWLTFTMADNQTQTKMLTIVSYRS